MAVRDGLARRFAGGPQFRIKPNELLIEVKPDGKRIQNARKTLDEIPSPSILETVKGKLSNYGFETKELGNTGVIVAKAQKLSGVIDKLQNARSELSSEAVTQLTKIREQASETAGKTILGGFSVGEMEFNEQVDSKDEAAIRNYLAGTSLRNKFTSVIEEFEGVLNAEMRYTRNTFGPRNLRVDPSELQEITPDFRDGKAVFSEDKSTLVDIRKMLNIDKAWEHTTGDDVVVAVFDTAFCEEHFDDDRIIDTFHGDDVDSAFSKKASEGHGSMTSVSAAGNTEGGAPFTGIAKDADLLLARVSDGEGALSHTAEAWDWLIGHLDELDRPVVSNHSYGVPMCSARGMGLCESTATKVARTANQRDDHIAVYAAGNSGVYCGHRLSGVTNGINGINSDPSGISVGALRSDGLGAQNYTSHGFGTCTSADEDPKPDVSAPIPAILPYACKTKDMSSGLGGSSGGTSTAAPITAGAAALIVSELGTAETEKVEECLEKTAEQPRRTQVNLIRGFDARFGKGMIKPDKAIEYARKNFGA